MVVPIVAIILAVSHNFINSWIGAKKVNLCFMTGVNRLHDSNLYFDDNEFFLYLVDNITMTHLVCNTLVICGSRALFYILHTCKFFRSFEMIRTFVLLNKASFSILQQIPMV